MASCRVARSGCREQLPPTDSGRGLRPRARGAVRASRARGRDAVRVVKRTGEVVEFDRERIAVAIRNAVRATGAGVAAEQVDAVVAEIVEEIRTRFQDFFPNVENIQDIVEKHLVLGGHYEVAKAYILYRADRQKARDAARQRAIEDARLGKLTAVKRDGRVVLFNVKKVEDALRRAADGLVDVDVDLVLREVVHNVYDRIPTVQVQNAMVLSAAAYIERDPAYNKLAARLQRQIVCREVIGRSTSRKELDKAYRDAFKRSIVDGLAAKRYDERLGRFDLDLMAASLKLERDDEFTYLGMQTLYDRYLMRNQRSEVLELPQGFWMRVAMGLSIEEPNATERALEFYEVFSQLLYVASTPTLFHSGTSHPQLSSCYLTTIDDHLAHIFKSLGDNAQLSKWSGGIGNDWSNIRATGAHIQSTNVDSQGVVPFLKIANDVTMAINRSGKRRGATCAYLETWHYDIEDFLDLRKNTGDDRRRTHDMNTANWIPDLFMKRVREDAHWTLFSPDEVPDLHHTYGRDFERRYLEYEARGERGEMRLYKRVQARDLWRKMLTMLFETGHPWITFKDACNVRSPQDHVGVIHSSNLCTEITLNTSADETAVCNLGSINLARHITDGRIDEARLAQTVECAIRMLDNVVDINFYPTPEARNSNLRHRPVGLGVMGFQDALYQLDVNFDSEEAIEVADRIGEIIGYHAILGSSRLAAERGTYESYPGSKWDRGLFPLDTLHLLEQERGVPVTVPRTERLDWSIVREHVAEHGMRNSNTMAIAPTATISNISGCFPCIEPIYKNIYVKANISGEFTIVNRYLVEDLKQLGLWGDEMLEQLKYYDGNVQMIDAIPEALRAKYKEAFEIDALHCIRLSAVRSKWIDQSQSHNVFLKGTSGKKLSEVYMAAWEAGLKTTYYLRSLAATQVEKSTLDAAKYGFTQKREYQKLGVAAGGLGGGLVADSAGAVPVPAASVPDGGEVEGSPAPEGRKVEPGLCRIDDPDCEACQ
ncbi:MAG: ribonucleoside-diphosphate reductase subunit alpha [Acidobacteria bacterium]|nr:MAG: ribonucleoside-diphosphate reductase subunit alpha [Acidobacteriota bacterium]